jgi:hypothetical protein
MGMRVGSSTAMTVSSGANLWQQQRQNFGQLSQALASGNLDAAKQVYANLAASKSTSLDPNTPIAKLGQALQLGDLKAAQDVFATMGVGRHHGAKNV